MGMFIMTMRGDHINGVSQDFPQSLHDATFSSGTGSKAF